MVLARKVDTLLQLSKADKEESGKQLLQLLNIGSANGNSNSNSKGVSVLEFGSEKARRVLHKNAFALVRLQVSNVLCCLCYCHCFALNLLLLVAACCLLYCYTICCNCHSATATRQRYFCWHSRLSSRKPVLCC
jgi:hypothetical protein